MIYHIVIVSHVWTTMGKAWLMNPIKGSRYKISREHTFKEIYIQFMYGVELQNEALVFVTSPVHFWRHVSLNTHQLTINSRTWICSLFTVTEEVIVVFQNLLKFHKFSLPALSYLMCNRWQDMSAMHSLLLSAYLRSYLQQGYKSLL